MREYHILNLGAGVQSTTLYLMMDFDYAIFADTGEEPEDVYDHLRWLQSLNRSPILIRSAGRLGDGLMRGKDGKGGRHASIPAFTEPGEPGRKEGRIKRQCTSDYKVDVVDRSIRRDVLGLKPRQWMPKDVKVIQYIGISHDEECRAKRIMERFAKIPWAEPIFPLLVMKWSRWQCLKWLKDQVPHPVPRSACVFCPYHSDVEWQRIKETDPDAWLRAVEIDRALRTPGMVVNRGLTRKAYLHRSLIPLEMVEFKSLPRPTHEGDYNLECAGMCGV